VCESIGYVPEEPMLTPFLSVLRDATLRANTPRFSYWHCA
jgi:hypothetical protein